MDKINNERIKRFIRTVLKALKHRDTLVGDKWGDYKSTYHLIHTCWILSKYDYNKDSKLELQ